MIYAQIPITEDFKLLQKGGWFHVFCNKTEHKKVTGGYSDLVSDVFPYTSRATGEIETTPCDCE